MPLDEYLYAKISNYFRKNRNTTAGSFEKMIVLDDVIQNLTIISRAITGQAIDIYPAEKEGGYKNNAFFLPSSISLFLTKETNRNFYFFRVLYLSIQKKLGVNFNSDSQVTEDAQYVIAQDNSPAILAELFEEYPVTKLWHDEFIYEIEQSKLGKQPISLSWVYGKLMMNSPENVLGKNLNNFDSTTQKKHENKTITTLKAKAVEEIISIEVDKKQQEDYMLTHNFEKVDTAEEFDGVWRDFDGDDELEKHQEALDELNMKFTVRVDDTAHSVYQADFIENTTISENSERDSGAYHVKYDEWNYAKNEYKENFCSVYPTSLAKSESEYYASTISRNAVTLIGLRKMLANINNKMYQQRRQTQGDEFDIDAIIDLYVDVHSGHTPSEKIYLSNRKKEKDLSILLLLDVSLSSDGYADGNRIIDVEKQVSILFGEILHEFNVDFSIQSFYSKTRNYSVYQSLKDFDEEWNTKKYVIGSVEPEGYTRIGAAIRHSGSLLEKRQTKNKWLILLSDGKPNDYDKYEGKYGINDVKQALQELYQRQINAYALAIEAQARFYLPQMFGPNHYQILTTPGELLQSLVKLYEKIKHK